MHRITTSALSLTLLLSPAFAQDAPKSESQSTSSTSISASTSSSGGDGASKSRSYKVVTKNGKVVEESGDKSLLRELNGKSGMPDLDDLMRRARSGLGNSAGSTSDSSPSGSSSSSSKSSDSSSSSHSRRVVVKNGETVVDEEFVDGKRVKPGARRGRASGRDMDDMRRRFPELDEMLRELERKGHPAVPGSRRGTRPEGSSRRVPGGRGAGSSVPGRLPPPASRPPAGRRPLLPPLKPAGAGGKTGKKGGKSRLG